MADICSSLIFVTLMMEALSSPEMLVLTRAMWRNIPEDDILHSHHRENLKSYTVVGMFYNILQYVEVLYSNLSSNTTASKMICFPSVLIYEKIS
jgi:hypothetical protein